MRDLNKRGRVLSELFKTTYFSGKVGANEGPVGDETVSGAHRAGGEHLIENYPLNHLIF